MQFSIVIHEARYRKVIFLHDMTSSFISWLCPLLKPRPFSSYSYIQLEGDEIDSIFFLIKGIASFVLPKYDNVQYININVGYHFGVIDIVGSCQMQDFDLEDWIQKRYYLQR